MRRCSHLLAPFAAGALILLIPFIKGAHYFKCGDAMMKFSTIAYLADSSTFEFVSATFLVIYTSILAIILGEFVPNSTLFSDGKRLTESDIRDIDNLKRPLIATDEEGHQAQQDETPLPTIGKRTRRRRMPQARLTSRKFKLAFNQQMATMMIQKKYAETERSTEHMPDETIVRGPSRRSLGDDIRHAKFVTLLRCFLYALVWILVLGGIGGAPTMLYTMTYSLPAENNLQKYTGQIQITENFLKYVSQFLAFYNAMFSSFILPGFTSLVVRKILAALQRAEMHEIYKLRSILSILSRQHWTSSVRALQSWYLMMAAGTNGDTFGPIATILDLHLMKYHTNMTSIKL